jgi:hypothetical protein
MIRRRWEHEIVFLLNFPFGPQRERIYATFYMQPRSHGSHNTCNVEIRGVEGNTGNVRRSAGNGIKTRRK